MYEAFPLHWPAGYKTTAPYNRINSSFKQNMDKAQQFLRKELDRLGAVNLVVSTDIPVRKDGGLYADYMSRKIDNPGVAIYFYYKNKQVNMCCDQYNRVWENIYALGKGIEALRGMERWGVSEFMERAFTGFQQLPEPINFWEILSITPTKDAEYIKKVYINLAKIKHPDSGGSTEGFQELQTAYQQALQYAQS